MGIGIDGQALGLGGQWHPWLHLGVSTCDTLCAQVYIGHSEPVQAVAFSPNQQQLLSVGDAIFLWDILAPNERLPPGRQVSALAPRLSRLCCTLPTRHPLLSPLQCPRLARGAPGL